MSSCSSLLASHSEIEIFFMFFFNHLNEGGRLQNQSSLLYEVSDYGDIQRRRKSHGADIWLLSTSRMAKKMD